MSVCGELQICGGGYSRIYQLWMISMMKGLNGSTSEKNQRVKDRKTRVREKSNHFLFGRVLLLVFRKEGDTLYGHPEYLPSAYAKLKGSLAANMD